MRVDGGLDPIAAWLQRAFVLGRSAHRALLRTIRVTAVSEAWLKELRRDSTRPTDW